MKHYLFNLSPKLVDNERVLSEILDISKIFLEKRGQIVEKVLSKKLDSIKEAIKKLLEKRDKIVSVWNQLHDHLSPNDNHHQVRRYTMLSVK